MLLKKGAEANIYLEEWRGRKVILKKRIPKNYRNKRIDETLRAFRTMRETRILSDAKRAGAAVPAVYHADVRESEILMEFIDGDRLRDTLSQMSTRSQNSLARGAGATIAALHKVGIIHGDVTTSNIIASGGHVRLIDFGLSVYSNLVEDMGVDLLLAKRSIGSTHATQSSRVFAAFLGGYKESMGPRATGAITKMSEVERRGRYSERTG
jgi:Kae1-associated kinase Bud32